MPESITSPEKPSNLFFRFHSHLPEFLDNSRDQALEFPGYDGRELQSERLNIRRFDTHYHYPRGTGIDEFTEIEAFHQVAVVRGLLGTKTFGELVPGEPMEGSRFGTCRDRIDRDKNVTLLEGRQEPQTLGSPVHYGYIVGKGITSDEFFGDLYSDAFVFEQDIPHAEHDYFLNGFGH